MKHITTISELVEFFGGDTALAARLDITQSAVAHWKKRQQIAAGWHLRLLVEISQQGATVDSHVFGLSPDDDAGEIFPGPLRSALRHTRPRKRRITSCSDPTAA